MRPLACRLRRLWCAGVARPPIGARIGPEEVVEALCAWGASMPWVAELECRRPERAVRRFVVDCPLLVCRAPWFAVDLTGVGADDCPEVLAAMPDAVARRGMAGGWATSTVDLGAGWALLTFLFPTTGAELRALQARLESAYAAAFAHPFGEPASPE